MHACNGVQRRERSEESHLAGGALVGSGAEDRASGLVLAYEAGGAPRLGQAQHQRGLEVKGGLDRRLKRGEGGRNGKGLGGWRFVRVSEGKEEEYSIENVCSLRMVREGEQRRGEGRGGRGGEGRGGEGINRCDGLVDVLSPEALGISTEGRECLRVVDNLRSTTTVRS